MSLRDLVNDYNEGGDYDNWTWFQLKHDGDTALVRPLVSNVEELEEFTHEVHEMKIGDWSKKVKCLGQNCPACASGDNPSLKAWIPFLVKEGGERDSETQLWERGLTDIKKLISLYDEYGDLKARDWKIKRNGKKGSTDTFYSFFPKDKSEIDEDELPDKPQILGEKSFFCLEMTKEQMKEALKGEYNPFEDDEEKGEDSTETF